MLLQLKVQTFSGTWLRWAKNGNYELSFLGTWQDTGDNSGDDGVDDEVNDGAGPRVKLPHMQFLSHYRVFSWAPIKELKTIKL